jgi:hypothetical protein
MSRERRHESQTGILQGLQKTEKKKILSISPKKTGLDKLI